jgi:hypothetical protein
MSPDELCRRDAMRSRPHASWIDRSSSNFGKAPSPGPRTGDLRFSFLPNPLYRFAVALQSSSQFSSCSCSPADQVNRATDPSSRSGDRESRVLSHVTGNHGMSIYLLSASRLTLSFIFTSTDLFYYDPV